MLADTRVDTPRILAVFLLGEPIRFHGSFGSCRQTSPGTGHPFRRLISFLSHRSRPWDESDQPVDRSNHWHIETSLQNLNKLVSISDESIIGRLTNVSIVKTLIMKRSISDQKRENSAAVPQSMGSRICRRLRNTTASYPLQLLAVVLTPALARPPLHPDRPRWPSSHQSRSPIAVRMVHQSEKRLEKVSSVI